MRPGQTLEIDFENPHYFNTTELKGAELVDAHANALTQEQIVYGVFSRAKKALSWSEVEGFVPDMVEISIKRSLTMLAKRGKLVKTQEYVLSRYGKKSHRYALPTVNKTI